MVREVGAALTVIVAAVERGASRAKARKQNASGNNFLENMRARPRIDDEHSIPQMAHESSNLPKARNAPTALTSVGLSSSGILRQPQDAEKLGDRNNSNASSAFQNQQVAFIAGHNVFSLGGCGAIR